MGPSGDGCYKLRHMSLNDAFIGCLDGRTVLRAHGRRETVGLDD